MMEVERENCRTLYQKNTHRTHRTNEKNGELKSLKIYLKDRLKKWGTA
jgi:hypothetical protein